MWLIFTALVATLSVNDQLQLMAGHIIFFFFYLVIHTKVSVHIYIYIYIYICICTVVCFELG
jgi:hypothetical protein